MIPTVVLTVGEDDSTTSPGTTVPTVHPMQPIPASLTAAALAIVLTAAAAGAPQGVAYRTEIRPLFLSRCVSCHGPQSQQNGLRLDDPARILRGGDSGLAVRAGKSGDSLLIQRITSSDPKQRMPPSGPPLSAAEVEKLRSWIDAGAQGDATTVGSSPTAVDHWAFRPIRPVSAPPVRQTGWTRNPIDRFVLAKLEKRGLKPSPEADRPTLLRRLSLDLIGLPPTAEEVDAFVRDTQPNAYDRVVDRLLASPHYGERWGRRWLDLARYADSNGYTIDSARSIWKYRDWVIGALNRDLPFDQFTIEQLAGDMLPNATQEQIIATGFHRNTLVNEEGGTDQEQFRVEAVVDRVNTTGAVWLGLTVGCAQCHTHKYDPITQREYYQLFAFLNNADEPTLSFPNTEQARRLATFQEQLTAGRRELKEYEASLAGHRVVWEQLAARNLRIPWRTLDPERLEGPPGMRLEKLADHSVLAGGEVPDNGNYTVSAPASGRISALRLEVLTHPSLPSRGPGFARGNFVLSEMELAAELPGSAMARKLEVEVAAADHSQKEYEIGMAVDGKPASGWAINVAKDEGRLNTDRAAVFVLKQPLDLPPGSRLVVQLKHEHPNRRYLIGRFRLSACDVPREEAEFVIRPEIRPLLLVAADRRSAAEQARVAAEFDRTDGGRARLQARLTDLEARHKEFEKGVPSTLVMQERATPRESHILIRGDFLRKGERVTPGVLEVLPPLPAGAKNPNRLDMARWLVDPRNPLTPRVTVNRTWQALFGAGLVETENDFGKQGTPPTHPALLDWLAQSFVSSSPPPPSAHTQSDPPVRATRLAAVRGRAPARRPAGTSGPAPAAVIPLGFSQKQLIRLVVTSATYRQASHTRADLAQVDPLNKLLGRQNRFRVDAEVIRDVALASSGMLTRKIGGPSVYPPAPANLDQFSQVKKNWEPSPGEDRYRRGMYTFWWRSNPFVMFTTFDAPGATTTCTRRVRSNTPLGALMLANDQGMFEMAQGLATRVMTDAPGSDEERLRLAFRRALGREPASHESRRLLQYYQGQLGAFQADPRAAEAVAPKQRPESFDAPQAAAWTAVSRVLMNLDEFITRE